MTRKLYLLLVALMATGFIAAGCGDDDDDGGGSDEPAATQEDTGGAAEEDTGGGGTAGSADEAIQQAVESCKTSVNSAPQLSDSVKGDLEDICDKAADGDEDSVREAAKEVCLKIIDESGLTGPTVDQAKQACEQTTAAP